MVVKDITEFDLSSKQSTGGVTGSVRVQCKDSYYQLKPSILDNSTLRRFKAGGTEQENFGEVIAAKICSSIFNSEKNQVTPEVELVLDKDSKRVLIASKYLKGEKVRTLDDFAEEAGVLKKKKHVKFVSGKMSVGEFDLTKDLPLKKDLARAVVASILVGDHDINPGNMIVVQLNGKERVARIDFGHAFNDLLNAPEIFGGSVLNKSNRVLDFLNRENVAGVPASKSKLWRDYPGLIPSQEMVDALNEAAESKGLKAGVENAKQEFKSLCSVLEGNQLIHVLKSLVVIAKSVGQEHISYKNISDEKVIEKVFSVIEKFCEENQSMMSNAAKLMQFQLDIDIFLNTHNRNDKDLRGLVDKFKELQTIQGIGTSYGDLIWIKNSSDKPAFKGTLQKYLNRRASELETPQVNLQTILDKNDKSAFTLAKPLRRLMSKPKLYLGVMALSVVAIFAVVSVLSAGVLPVLAVPAISFLVSCFVGGAAGYKVANHISDKNDMKAITSGQNKVIIETKQAKTSTPEVMNNSHKPLVNQLQKIREGVANSGVRQEENGANHTDRLNRAKDSQRQNPIRH